MNQVLSGRQTKPLIRSVAQKRKRQSELAKLNYTTRVVSRRPTIGQRSSRKSRRISWSRSGSCWPPARARSRRSPYHTSSCVTWCRRHCQSNCRRWPSLFAATIRARHTWSSSNDCPNRRTIRQSSCFSRISLTTTRANPTPTRHLRPPVLHPRERHVLAVAEWAACRRAMSSRPITTLTVSDVWFFNGDQHSPGIYNTSQLD